MFKNQYSDFLTALNARRITLLTAVGIAVSAVSAAGLLHDAGTYLFVLQSHSFADTLITIFSCAFAAILAIAVIFKSGRSEAGKAESLQTDYDLITGVLNSAVATIFITDSHGKVIRMNKAGEELILKSEAAIKGLFIWDILSATGSDTGILRYSFEGILKSGDKRKIETHHSFKSTAQTIEWSSARISDPAHDSLYIAFTGKDITERRRNEFERMQREEEALEQIYQTGQKTKTLDTILNVTPDLILMMSRNGKFLYMSLSAASFFKTSQENIAGKTWRELNFPAEIMERFDRERNWVCATATTFAGELILLKDSQQQYFEYIIHPIFSDMGNTESVVITMRDVTERTIKDELLRKSEEQYRTLLTRLPIPVGLYDSEKILYVNPAAADLLKAQSPNEIIGQHPLSIVHPTLYEESIERMTAFFKGEVTENKGLEWKYVDVKNGEIDVELSSIAVKYAGKTAIMTTARDITQHKKAEQQIIEQAALLNKAQDAIFVEDLDGGIAFWNKSAESLYGWKSGEIIGKSSAQLYSSPADFKNTREHVLNSGEWTGELHNTSRSGNEIIVQSRWTLVHDDLGRPKSILIINTDITAKLHFEKQALRAQRLESIGRMVGGIAHDLNNTLAPIQLSVDMLRLPIKQEQTARMLDIIETSARNSAGMVRQMLLFARGNDGKRERVNAAKVLSDVEKVIMETFPVTIHTALVWDSDLWDFMGDETQFHQIITNLCVNAKDALDAQGSIKITARNIRLEEADRNIHIEAQPGPYIMVEVSDTGSGIPPEILEKIFEPFFTTKEIGKGTGLGLSTVMAIVKNHGGFLNVKSELGKGTTFTIYIPALAQNKLLKSDTPQATPVKTTAHGPSSKSVILIVEDEEAVREMITMMLERNGYSVLGAENGEQALEIYHKYMNSIQLVITDMMMPVMDGEATIKALKKHNPKVKIIASSAVHEKYQHLTTTGAVLDFLPKPYTSSKLLGVLEKALNEKLATV
ncbi:MAG TPA: PAS domain S-box protein [Patescibacteria group bacterium]|nr:PAS domain S-box protein [Patescibacteria group bacterium]